MRNQYCSADSRINMAEFFAKKNNQPIFKQNYNNQNEILQKNIISNFNESSTTISYNSASKNQGPFQQQSRENMPNGNYPLQQQSVQKQQNNEQQNIQKDPNLMCVPCMNCKELISIDQIDYHSTICKVSLQDNEITPLEEINIRIEKLMNMFLKLIDDLAISANKNKKSSAFEMITSILTRMFEIAQEIKDLSQYNQTNSKIYRELMNEIVLINKTQPGSVGIKLYLERLFSLGQAKFKLLKKNQNFTDQKSPPIAQSFKKKPSLFQNEQPPIQLQDFRQNNHKNNSGKYQSFTILEESPRNTQHNNPVDTTMQSKNSSHFDLKTKLQQKKLEMTNLMKQSDTFKNKAVDDQRQINQVINISSKTPQKQYTESDQQSMRSFSMKSGDSNNKTVVSNLTGGQTYKSYTQTAISSSQISADEFDGIDDINFHIGIIHNQMKIKILDYNSNEDDRQRLFYAKCLPIKMKFQKQSIAHKIPISILYKETVELDLPINEWDQFIDYAYNHCEDYLDLNKFGQKRGKGLRNKLRGIAKKLEIQQNKKQI